MQLVNLSPSSYLPSEEMSQFRESTPLFHAVRLEVAMGSSVFPLDDLACSRV